MSISAGKGRGVDTECLVLQIMAMKHPRVVIFTGAISALAVMTVLSGASHHQCGIRTSGGRVATLRGSQPYPFPRREALIL